MKYKKNTRKKNKNFIKNKSKKKYGSGFFKQKINSNTDFIRQITENDVNKCRSYENIKKDSLETYINKCVSTFYKDTSNPICLITKKNDEFQCITIKGKEMNESIDNFKTAIKQADYKDDALKKGEMLKETESIANKLGFKLVKNMWQFANQYNPIYLRSELNTLKKEVEHMKGVEPSSIQTDSSNIYSNPHQNTKTTKPINTKTQNKKINPIKKIDELQYNNNLLYRFIYCQVYKYNLGSCIYNFKNDVKYSTDCSKCKENNNINDRNCCYNRNIYFVNKYNSVQNKFEINLYRYNPNNKLSKPQICQYIKEIKYNNNIPYLELREKEDKKTRQNAILIINKEQADIIQLILESMKIQKILDKRVNVSINYIDKMKKEGLEQKYFDSL